MLRGAPEAHDACREIVMSSDWALSLLIESTRYLASDGQAGSNPSNPIRATAVFEVKGKISVDTALGRFIIILIR